MENLQLPHKLTLSERKSLIVTGVTEVVSFDDTQVALETTLGTLEIQGEQLKLLSLGEGQVSVEGSVQGLYYVVPRQSSFWGRRNR